ncbi:MAG: Poly(A) polymerase I [Steroidobacteraceae bacterium]|nr:Poly(A) polymerase I [Steroidobacteraceae bacterium]
MESPAPLARVVPRADHSISRAQISPNALRVLYRLKDAGFQGFLVGGCVRDLLIGRTPKDFDVATNALPEEVKRLFRNCRLIGRRFRLAHVFFGSEIIEVATFRAASAPAQGEEPLADLDPEEGEGPELSEPEEFDADVADTQGEESHVLDEHGRILRDNAYGTIDDDVWRRDFTANALYYNIADYSIWDYVGGLEDVLGRRLRVIGDPETRFREDPVRMLRAARFAAKLDFTIDPPVLAAIHECAGLLAAAPPARLFDETLKLFLAGHGAASFAQLRRLGLLEVLLPTVESYFRRHPHSLVEQLLERGLENTDARVREGKSVTPTYLFALLLYGPIAQAIEALPPNRWHESGAILDACDAAARALAARVALPRRFSLGVREMFALQPRLEQPRGRRALRLLEHPRFRAAYDLLLLRAGLGLAPPDMAAWWTTLQAAAPEERGRLADALSGGSTRGAGGTRRPRRRRRSGGGAKPAA